MIRTINSIACSREEDCDNCPIKNECDEIEYGTSSFNLWAIYEKALDDFANELKWLFSMYYTGSLNSKDIDDIVKELKKGTEENE